MIALGLRGQIETRDLPLNKFVILQLIRNNCPSKRRENGTQIKQIHVRKPKTTSDTNQKSPVSFTKPENQMLQKNLQTAMNKKTEKPKSFDEKPKISSKKWQKPQKRKSLNAPLLMIIKFTRSWQGFKLTQLH